MRTIRRDGEHELVVNRSRFIAALCRVDTEEAARKFVAARRRRHWDARHHCTAYVLGLDRAVMRSSDDGEPSGTAGVPMLEVLKQREVVDTVAVVTRYFGGVKLGAGGLVRAYSAAVAAAVDALGTVELRRVDLVTVTVPHRSAGRLEAELRASPYRVTEVSYLDRVEVGLALEPAQAPGFADWLAARSHDAQVRPAGTAVVAAD